ncbi:uncharacterized protein [Elaeis guineensis]|uniref:uncharacterized protein n=1 Tax=Elaeis guineensis var. tenera TaxID=51953 RepID=UPI003C6D7B92
MKRLWNEWQLSVLVLLSLFLQLILILTAHLRKTRPSEGYKIFYWLAYLSSTYLATYCLGIISQDSSEDKAADPDMQLRAFWAPILLFHLGGLDNFTALTLEDNQLWIRHAAELCLRAATTGYIFIRFFPGGGGYRGLLLPFIFIFVAAFLKCIGRALALRKGSLEGLRESMLGEPEPGPDYADTMDRYVGKLRSGVPPLLNISEESRQATPMLEDPNTPAPYQINKESRLPTPMVGVANPSVSVPTADTVDDHFTPNSSLQSSTTLSMRPSTSFSDNVPTAYKFFLRSKDREQTELAGQQSSNFVSSSGVKSSNSTETMITSSSTLHGSIRHPSIATEVKEVAGVTQHHHSTPDPSFPSSSTHLCSTEIQNSSQIPSSTGTKIETTEDMSTIIPTAYELLSVFKGVLVDAIFSFKDREWSQDKFLDRSWKWAFNVTETELSFAYDILYTKASISRTSIKERETVSRTGWRGTAIRVLSLVLTGSTLLLFIFQADRMDEFLLQHRCVTYALLVGAVIIDIVTLLQFIVSDWSFVDGRRHASQECVSNARWSNLMSQYNLISFCLKDRPSTFNKILGGLGLKESLDHHRYTRFALVDDELKEFLFTELRDKEEVAKKSKDYKPFTICRGDWALRRVERLGELGWSVQGADFDESLLIWHIATDLCYHSEKNHVATYAAMAKRLSDYMLYLLVLRPLMLFSYTVMGTKR